MTCTGLRIEICWGSGFLPIGSTSMVWVTESAIKAANLFGKSTLVDVSMAALRPCPPLPDVKPKDGFYEFNTRHYVGYSMCFAKVGLYMRPFAVLQDFHSHIESLPITTGSIFFQ